MIDEKTAPPPHVNPWQASAPEPNRWRQPETFVHRFLGGTPVGVVVKLFFLSLIVGALLMWLDIRPVDIFQGLIRVLNRVWALGFDAVRELGDYLLAGAVIVVPVWLVFRLLSMRGPR
jgi:Family of unknown function (DUF6460)